MHKVSDMTLPKNGSSGPSRMKEFLKWACIHPKLFSIKIYSMEKTKGPFFSFIKNSC